MESEPSPAPDALPAPRKISRQALWQQLQREKGNCTSCGKPRGNSYSRHRCEDCAYKLRLSVRVRSGVSLNKPIQHWPREWAKLPKNEYSRLVRKARKEAGLLPHRTTRINRKWPAEWLELGQAEYQRRIRMAKQGLNPNKPPKTRLRHPKEWRSLPPTEYQKKAKAARYQWDKEQAALKKAPPPQA